MEQYNATINPGAIFAGISCGIASLYHKIFQIYYMLIKINCQLLGKIRENGAKTAGMH